MKKIILIVGLMVFVAGCQHTTLGKRMEMGKQKKAELSQLDNLYAPLILEAKNRGDMDRQVELDREYLSDKTAIEERYRQMDRDLSLRSIETSLRGINVAY